MLVTRSYLLRKPTVADYVAVMSCVANLLSAHKHHCGGFAVTLFAWNLSPAHLYQCGVLNNVIKGTEQNKDAR